VDALIVALGGNDLLRGIAPEVSRANLQGILSAAAANSVPVLLVGMQAPGNYGPDYKDAFDSIYPDLSADFDTLLHPGFFDALAPDGDPSAAQKFMQPDGIHPNAEGVSLIIADIGPQVLALISRTNH
jgi:acyl-CoA thioesterase-1